MMLIQQLIDIIEDTADFSRQADWDKSGLQVASERKEVSHIAVMLDARPKQLRKAVEIGADFILAHHPLAIKPDLPRFLNAYQEALKILLCANVPLYSAHTSLDTNPYGPAGWFGRALNLQNCEILEPLGNFKHEQSYGFGEVGDLPQALNLEEFKRKVFDLLDIDYAIGHNLNKVENVSRIAYCGGSGASLLNAAIKSCADLYITGDVKYHEALESEIAILDVGHHSIEEKMMEYFSADLQKTLPELKFDFIPSQSPFELVT